MVFLFLLHSSLYRLGLWLEGLLTKADGQKLEQNYFEACTKYPFRSKFNRHESFKKLLPHHVEDARQEADNALDRLRMDLINEQDTLRHRMKAKYDITVESERQRIDREFEETNNENK